MSACPVRKPRLNSAALLAMARVRSVCAMGVSRPPQLHHRPLHLRKNPADGKRLRATRSAGWAEAPAEAVRAKAVTVALKLVVRNTSITRCALRRQSRWASAINGCLIAVDVNNSPQFRARSKSQWQLVRSRGASLIAVCDYFDGMARWLAATIRSTALDTTLARMHCVNHVDGLSVVPSIIVTMRPWDGHCLPDGELNASQQPASSHLLLAGRMPPMTCR